MADNQYAGKLGWAVGLERWLDDEAAMVKRYWRAIEFEGQNYDGLILIGLWGDRAGQYARPGEVRSGPMSASGDGIGQKWVPFGAHHDAASALARAKFAFHWYITKGRLGTPSAADLSVLHGENPKVQLKVFWAIMKTPDIHKIPFVTAKSLSNVEPRHYYTKAIDSFDPMVVMETILRREISDLMDGVFGQSKARGAMGAETNSSSRKGRAKQSVGKGQIRSEIQRLTGITTAGRGGGIVTIAAGASLQDLIRTGSGQFPSGAWQTMLVEVNRRVAEQFQQHLVTTMENGPHFRLPTDNLVKATADPRNRYPQ